jgi:hypothetical protein
MLSASYTNRGIFSIQWLSLFRILGLFFILTFILVYLTTLTETRILVQLGFLSGKIKKNTHTWNDELYEILDLSIV